MNLSKTCLILICVLGLTGSSALAQEAGNSEAAAPAPTPSSTPTPTPTSLFELLDLVEKGLEVEKAENVRREREFQQQKENQAQLLAEAKAELARIEGLSLKYEATYNEYDRNLGQLEADLVEQLGQMGELFGVVRQVANDTGGQVWDSLISSQLGDRKELLDRLGRSKELPSTSDLERLWFELQREMTEQGQVVRYRAQVLTSEGNTEERDVVRAGPFSAVSRGKFLLWEPTENKLRELTRQPPSRYVDTVSDFESLESGYAMLALDPSRGSLLNALTDTPSPQERVDQGGAVGYVIIILGLAAFSLGIWRWAVVLATSRKVSAQQKSDYVDKGNPLGRVLAVYEDNREVDAETLELKLDEAVLRESSAITRYMWLVKTVSAIAPLLGLLGTVTGMIKTFQAITLFGAGDPKMMAGGISEALVTTMLGLITAIPLVLLYDTLANSTRYIIDVLDEQSAGLIASRSERDSVGD
ncbi:MAG: MotA/TolQ/ExbB proton channel family protein [Deltaproteobacteria bacterium]|nr:MotA/TolQ/ExbB proton channel family protein [Deltaproteobacteria bacterium]